MDGDWSGGGEFINSHPNIINRTVLMIKFTTVDFDHDLTQQNADL